MEKVTLVRQFAKALFLLGREAKVVDRIAAELEAVDRRIDSEPDAGRLLRHPEAPPDAKRRLLQLLMPEDVTPETKAFLSLLVQRRYLKLLPDVIKAYILLREESFGVLKAEVESARPLTEEARERLKEVLSGLTERGVVIVEKSNPGLLGGLRVRIGDRIVDGSVTGRLELLKRRLMGSPLPAQA